MSILGNNTLPGSGFFFDTTGNKQCWTARQFSMPSGGGYATNINVYVGGDGGSRTGQLVIWDSGTNIVWQSGNITLPSGSRNINGQGWVTASIPSLYLAAGNYEIGFWSSGAVVWTFEGSGGVNARGGLSSPSNNSGNNDEYGGSGFGELGAYVTYTPLGAPTITSATPNTGTTGTSVAIVGTNLLQASAVTINGAAASFTVNSDTSITATVPAGASAGTGSLVVTTPAGTASTPFTVGPIYGDTGGAYVGGVVIYADDGVTWWQCTSYGDTGVTWLQIG